MKVLLILTIFIFACSSLTFSVTVAYNTSIWSVHNLSPAGNSITITVGANTLGTFTYNAMLTDEGTSIAYVFNTLPVTVTVTS